jgi:hypothetical protein
MTRAILAIEPAGPYGYCVQYPGFGSVLHGEFRDHLPFLDQIDTLLQNGFTWRVLLSGPPNEGIVPQSSPGHVTGAVWYLAAKHGAEFYELPAPANVTDGQLDKARLWRRGMSAANRAARLLLETT